MTSVLDRGPAAAAEPVASPARSRLPSGSASRRPVTVIVSAFVVLASIAAFTSLYSSADHQRAVLVVTRTIPQGQVITGSDLGQAQVSVSGGVAPIPVADASELGGRRAVSTIPAGSLLVPSDLTTAPQVATGDAIVGLSLKPGELPADGVEVGDQVMVVQTGSPGTTAGSGESVSGSAGVADGATGILIPQATVFETSAPSTQTAGGASELVSVEVSATLAAAVSTAAVADQVSLVLLPDTTGTGSTP